MARLDDTLSRHNVVGLDTMVFIYSLEASTPVTDVAKQILRLVERNVIPAVTSEITIMELMVRPRQLGRPDIAAGYDALISNFPNLTVAPLSRVTILRAAELRASHGLHALDALQVAACIASGATAFVTNDYRLRRIPELEVFILDDYLDTAD